MSDWMDHAISENKRSEEAQANDTTALSGEVFHYCDAVLGATLRTYILNGEWLAAAEWLDAMGRRDTPDPEPTAEPGFKVGDTVKFRNDERGESSLMVYEVHGVNAEFVNLFGIRYYHQDDLELVHVHHFTCECGEGQ